MTSEQHRLFAESRRKYLGGTDLAALAGLSKWATPLSVYNDKVGITPYREPSLAMMRGSAMEPVLRETIKRDLGHDVLPAEFVVHPDHPYMGGNPDGYIGEDAIWEGKTYSVTTMREWGEEGSDKLPLGYAVQTQWYMGLTGRQHAIVTGYNMAYDKATNIVLAFDPELFAMLVQAGVDFYENHWAKGVPPDPGGGDTEWFKEHFRDSIEEVVYSEPEIDDKVLRCLELKGEIKERVDALDILKNDIRFAIGDAAVMETAYGTITYRTSKPGSRFDVKAAVKDGAIAQSIVDQYTKTNKAARPLKLPDEVGGAE